MRRATSLLVRALPAMHAGVALVCAAPASHAQDLPAAEDTCALPAHVADNNAYSCGVLDEDTLHVSRRVAFAAIARIAM